LQIEVGQHLADFPNLARIVTGEDDLFHCRTLVFETDQCRAYLRARASR
jgi:hypothetical protein